MNVVMVCPNQRVGLGPCYNCGGFGYLARNCWNKGTENRIGKRKRLEYGQRLRIERGQGQDNLNGEGDLVVLN